MMRKVALAAMMTAVMVAVHTGATAGEGPVAPSDLAVLVYSSELLGAIKPCSTCGTRPLGGLAGRAGFLAAQSGTSVDFVALEGGDLCGRKSKNGELEFQVILSALDVMGYGAVGLGERDLELGPDFLETVMSRTDVALLCGNVVTEDGRHLFSGHTIVDVSIGGGTARIGVIGVISDIEGFRIRAESGGFTIEDPDAAVRRSLDAVEDVTDVQVVLYHGVQKEAEELVSQFPSIDLVLLTTHILGPPKSLSEEGQSVRLITGGREGKFLAAVKLSKSYNGDVNPHAFNQGRIDETIVKDPQIQALVETFYEAILVDKARDVPPASIAQENSRRRARR